MEEEITSEIRKYLEMNENKNATTKKFVVCSKSSAKKEIYSCKCIT